MVKGSHHIKGKKYDKFNNRNLFKKPIQYKLPHTIHKIYAEGALTVLIL